jgi:hypothetical protein
MGKMQTTEGFSGDRTEHLIWRMQDGEVDDISPKLAVTTETSNRACNRLHLEKGARYVASKRHTNQEP